MHKQNKLPNILWYSSISFFHPTHFHINKIQISNLLYKYQLLKICLHNFLSFVMMTSYIIAGWGRLSQVQHSTEYSFNKIQFFLPNRFFSLKMLNLWYSVYGTKMLLLLIEILLKNHASLFIYMSIKLNQFLWSNNFSFENGNKTYSC